MDISLKLENKASGLWAVFVDGKCVAHGLAEAEANKVLSQKLNESLSQPQRVVRPS